MELPYFIKGVILGFSMAAPVGPIGILCIRKTLQFGRLSGFASGLGAAVADMIYGIIAAFGLTFVSDFLLAQQFWLRLVGGCFLVYLGGRTFFAQAIHTSPPNVTHKTILTDFISTFFLTLSNPMTVLSFVAVFAALGLIRSEGTYGSTLWLVGGIFIGSATWWLILSEGVTYFRKRLSHQVMIWVNRCAGMLIIGFGFLAWFSLLHLQSP